MTAVMSEVTASVMIHHLQTKLDIRCRTCGVADGDAGVELGGLQDQLAHPLAGARLRIAAAVDQLLRQLVHVLLLGAASMVR